MSQISRSTRGAASFLAEAHRLRGLAAEAAQPWMRQALERIAQGYEQLAASSDADAGASMSDAD